MDTATQILVIIVSTLLSLTLIMGIFMMVAIMKVVKNLQRVTAKAEQIVDDAESAASMFRSAAGPLTLLKTIANIVDAVTKHKKGK
jgi:hypothetical protein